MPEAQKALPPLGQMALPPCLRTRGGRLRGTWLVQCLGPLSECACGPGGRRGKARPLKAAEMHPKTSGSVARDAANGGGGRPVEHAAGDGGEPCGAGGTWGGLVEEWASLAGLWLLSMLGGVENRLVPFPPNNREPTLAAPPPPPGQAGGHAWAASWAWSLRAPAPRGGGGQRLRRRHPLARSQWPRVWEGLGRGTEKHI